MANDRVLLVGDGHEVVDLAARLRQAGRECELLEWTDHSRGPLDPGEVARHAGGATVVIEFVEGTGERKRAVVRELAGLKGRMPLLVSSSLRFGPTEIGSWCADPSCVVGFSGLPPFSARRHIELQRGLSTGPASFARAAEVFTACGFAVEPLGDHPGGVQLRLVCGIINEAAGLLAEAGAAAEDIDAGMRLGTNYPQGPLRWADEIGLDRVLAVLEGLEREYREDRYRAVPLLRKMVLAGRLGIQSGSGFYVHS